MKFKSLSPEETYNSAGFFWENFVKKNSSQALVICLYGDLGAGKTVFVQGLAHFLGLVDKINSPTFVISRKYCFNNSEFKHFFHLD
ncbi:MAG TPA: tRNA (adenosine(37)-N6)-threonylcarbamoyltransferase complex ATPase subunit type 1 TsaE, partial [Candidatus Vogelbacteria bacterium]|nr:tRNA (adenosine(37)-N6)-threonylcarbamoyltransferase complex ATPase subunit type 1 TsaE [Candidatus Vogelbacteria bacterium]